MGSRIKRHGVKKVIPRKKGIIRIRKLGRGAEGLVRDLIGVPTDRQVKKQFSLLGKEKPHIKKNYNDYKKENIELAKQYPRFVVVHGHKAVPNADRTGFVSSMSTNIKN